MGVCGTGVTSGVWHAATHRPRTKATGDVRRLLDGRDRAFRPAQWGGKNLNGARSFLAFVRWLDSLRRYDPALAEQVLLCEPE